MKEIIKVFSIRMLSSIIILVLSMRFFYGSVSHSHENSNVIYDIISALLGAAVFIIPFSKIKQKIYFYIKNLLDARSASLEENIQKLSNDVSKLRKEIKNSEEIKNIDNKLEKITKEYKDFFNNNRKGIIKGQIESEIKMEIKRGAYNLIEEKFKSQIERKTKLNIIKENKNRILNRIHKSIDFIERSSRKHMALGLYFSFSGLIFTIISVLKINGNSILDTHENIYFMEYLQKSSIVLCSELIGFFFFRTYRSSINEIKYFNNEMTNIEVIFSALETAVFSGNQKLIDIMCEKLIITERNFILKKGEATLSLMSQENENKGDEKVFAFVESMTDKILRTQHKK